jgi:hypothetical protein
MFLAPVVRGLTGLIRRRPRNGVNFGPEDAADVAERHRHIALPAGVAAVATTVATTRSSENRAERGSDQGFADFADTDAGDPAERS